MLANSYCLILVYFSSSSVVGQIMPLFPKVQVIIPKRCECVPLFGKREFTDIIKDLEMGRLSQTVQCNHSGPSKRGGREAVRRYADGTSRGHRSEDLMLQALKMEEGATTRRIQVGTRS